ncbi:retrovirus-related pol polyprotein from transposon TNT 1-94 [Tanacetum coccineum]
MGLWYPKDFGFELTAFSDADHVRCLDTRKSTSGGIQFLGDKLVSWMSKKQNCTVMSSAEAEYVALSASCAQSAIAITCNPVQHSKTKHIYNPGNLLHKRKQVEKQSIMKVQDLKTKTSANSDLKLSRLCHNMRNVVKEQDRTMHKRKDNDKGSKSRSQSMKEQAYNKEQRERPRPHELKRQKQSHLSHEGVSSMNSLQGRLLALKY